MPGVRDVPLQLHNVGWSAEPEGNRKHGGEHHPGVEKKRSETERGVVWISQTELASKSGK